MLTAILPDRLIAHMRFDTLRPCSDATPSPAPAFTQMNAEAEGNAWITIIVYATPAAANHLMDKSSHANARRRVDGLSLFLQGRSSPTQ
jgi:hypothetical protein